MVRTVLGVAMLLVLGVLAYLGTACALQRSVMYPRPPFPATPLRPADVEVLLVGAGADVEAWYLPAPPSQEPAPVLIFTHGNGELIDHWLGDFQTPRPWGVAVLLVEYPGYGRSGGSPSEESITEAIVGAYDALAARPEIDATRIVAYGRSLGGGAACALSRHRPLAALVLESSFTSVREVAAGFGLPGFLVLDPFDNLEAVGSFDGPVLVLHGERDTIIPVKHGKALAKAAGTDLQTMPCGHNDCPRPWAEIRAFLEAHSLLPGP